MKKFISILLTTICFFIVLFLVGSYLFKKESTVSETKGIEIFEGATVRDISTLLESYGAIENSDYFYNYIRIKSKLYELKHKKPLELVFRSGIYDINTGNFDSLIEQLNSAPSSFSSENTFTFPEGSSIDDLIKILSSSGFGSEEEILSIIENLDFYNELKSKYVWLPPYNENKIYQLEGYLHANTYHYDINSTVQSVIDSMISKTDEIAKKYNDAIYSSGYDFDQLITLASIVEAESKFSEDRPKVAQVFINRLNIGMKLESDITASYANQEHKVFMYYDDIKTDSPYNTYITPTLPLGPINSPSIESILAVLNPEGSSFNALYFYAKPNGETFYANDFSEHEANRLKYEHEWKSLENKTP